MEMTKEMEQNAQPPQPPGGRFLGNLKQIRRESRQFYANCTEKYGGLFRFRILTFTSYAVTDPELVEQVLVTNRRTYIKGKSWNIMRAFAGNGLLTSDGEDWFKQRRLAQPAFHRSRIEGYGQIMTRLAERYLEGCKPGQTRDIFKDMRKLTLEIACQAFFSSDIAGKDSEVGRIVENAIHEFDLLTRRTLPLPLFLPTSSNQRYKKALKQLEKVVYRLIAERRSSGTDRGDLLSMLLQARDEDGSKLNDKQLKDEVLTLLIAGHETTAVAITWALYLINRHSQVESRLKKEIAETLKNRTPAISDLPKLKYLDRVIKETLRLYPSFWITVRDSVKESILGGYRIPAGARVCLMPWVTHRNPRYFPEPETFNPDRWTPEFEQNLPRFAYYPFGGGPRQCIGNSFALTETALVLATLLQKFNFSLVSGQEIKLSRNVVIRPETGLFMHLS
jgi:cytochrome P450